MIYFCNANGTTELVQSTPIYQGSSLASNITVVAPFPSYLEVTIAFKLPNGIITEPSRMTSVPIGGNIKIGNVQANAWQYLIESSITEYAGTVQVQFYFYNSNSILASYSSQFQVQRGVQAKLPTTPDQDIYDEILGYLSTVNDGIGYGFQSIKISGGVKISVSKCKVLSCTDDAANGFVVPGTTTFPYYSDLIGGPVGGLTSAKLVTALNGNSFNQVIYNPKKIDKFSPYGLRITLPINYDVGNFVIYSKIILKNQSDGTANPDVPDRYKLQAFDNLNNLLFSTIIENSAQYFGTVIPVNSKNVAYFDLVVYNSTSSDDKTNMLSSGCLPIYHIDIFTQSKTTKYTITNYDGSEYEIDMPNPEKYEADLNDLVSQAQGYASSASSSATSAENALTEINNKAGKSGGYPILEEINNEPKIPSVYIQQVDIKEYIEIQNESQLATVEAQPGDVAFLTETINGEKTVTKSWILLSVENNVRNWAVFGTSYATNAGNAVQAETATNALQINGVIYKSVTEAEYNDLIDKSGIYFVTYPNATSESGTSESESEIL